MNVDKMNNVAETQSVDEIAEGAPDDEEDGE